MEANSGRCMAVDAIPTQELAEVIAAEFGLRPVQLVRISEASHNSHFIAGTPSGDVHVTLRDLASKSDTVSELEAIAQVEASLQGPTGALVRTNLRNRHGHFLVSFKADVYLSVREHWGEVCRKQHDVMALVNTALAHGSALDQANVGGLRAWTPSLRYMRPQESLVAMQDRFKSFVFQHTDHRSEPALVSCLDRVSRFIAKSNRLRLVHGDLAYGNVIAKEGDLYVIDHDCLHQDHPLYDLAHLMLSVSCKGYFRGAFDRKIGEEFGEAVHHRSQERIDYSALCEVASYVLLKKMALVRSACNLFVEERLAILDELNTV